MAGATDISISFSLIYYLFNLASGFLYAYNLPTLARSLNVGERPNVTHRRTGT